MFWILRRTGAVNFFNSINNNHSSNNKISDKNNTRPPRKAYGRLSVDADDVNLCRKNMTYHTPTNANDDDDDDDGRGDGDGDGLGRDTFKFQTIANDTLQSNNNHHSHHHHHHQPDRKPTTGSGTKLESDSNPSKNCNGNNNSNNIDGVELNLETGETTVEHHKRVISDMQDDQRHQHHHHGTCHNSCHPNSALTTSSSCREFRENMLRNGNIDDKTITRLQAMALQDEDEFDESLTCNVCDRTFHCHRQLASHQQKKRHFGCSGCDSLFPSLMLLEHHKEEFEHWSDDEMDDRRMYCCKRNRRMDDDDFYDTDTATSDAESEDLERLL